MPVRALLRPVHRRPPVPLRTAPRRTRSAWTPAARRSSATRSPSAAGSHCRANDTFFCGILADRIDFAAQNLRVKARAAPGRRGRRAPTLVPTLALDLDVDRADALPARTLRHTATSRNVGATLVVPGVIGVENLGTAPVTVTGHTLALEYHAVGDGAWHPMLGPSRRLSGPTLSPASSIRPGGGRVDGTIDRPGALASWGYPGRPADGRPDRLCCSIRARSRRSATSQPSTSPGRRASPPTLPFRRGLHGPPADLGAMRRDPLSRSSRLRATPRFFAAPRRRWPRSRRANRGGLPRLHRHPPRLPGRERIVRRLSRATGLVRRQLLIGTASPATCRHRPGARPAPSTTTTRHLPVVALDKTGPAGSSRDDARYALGLTNGARRRRARSPCRHGLRRGRIPSPGPGDPGRRRLRHGDGQLPVPTAAPVSDTGSVPGRTPRTTPTGRSPTP